MTTPTPPRPRKAPRTAFKKGHKKLGGRKLGTKNKFTRDIKEGLLTAYEQLGGPAFFVKLGRSPDDRKALASLLGKLLPSQITGANGGPLELEMVKKVSAGLTNLTDKEIDTLTALLSKLGLDIIQSSGDTQ